MRDDGLNRLVSIGKSGQWHGEAFYIHPYQQVLFAWCALARLDWCSTWSLSCSSNLICFAPLVAAVGILLYALFYFAFLGIIKLSIGDTGRSFK
jgi:hypothetical protein